MIKRIVPMLALVALAWPASAQDWGTGFNMGTHLAGGGSDANGWLSFECADKGSDSGFATEGQPFLSLRPMAGVVLSKKSIPHDGIAFWVGDDMSFLLPMSLEPGGKTLSYDYSEESVQEVRYLVDALRQGKFVTAYAGGLEDTRLVSITLEGSYGALEFIEGCIADAP